MTRRDSQPRRGPSLTPKQRSRLRKTLKAVWATSFGILVLVAFLMPLGYGITMALKTDTQISKTGAPLWPASERTFTYEGETYDIYLVPTEDGVEEWALVTKRREESWFIDPDNPEAGEIRWEGRWRTLERAWEPDPQWGNFREAWDTIDYPLLLRNTLMYALLSTFGAVFSAAIVAYGFARFPIPNKGLLFMIVIATIILPPAVTLIPTYAFFYRIGWVGTWLPLIVPAFFSNGYNVFLMRQFFLTIPYELDEAATIDGANPLRIFWSVILPNSKAALVAVGLFHFFYCWNDFFGPLIYLAGNPEKFPITVGLTAFNHLYSQSSNLIQAASLIAVIVPLIVFFIAQRYFVQGVVITGVEK
ncbi:MAG: carbohydrate ABC transporter permease [Anaerolineae bacterium]|jgi:multiple sugar transport system permease protein